MRPKFSSFTKRFCLIHVLYLWIIGTLDKSDRKMFPLQTGCRHAQIPFKTGSLYYIRTYQYVYMRTQHTYTYIMAATEQSKYCVQYKGEFKCHYRVPCGDNISISNSRLVFQPKYFTSPPRTGATGYVISSLFCLHKCWSIHLYLR